MRVQHRWHNRFDLFMWEKYNSVQSQCMRHNPFIWAEHHKTFEGWLIYSFSLTNPSMHLKRARAIQTLVQMEPRNRVDVPMCRFSIDVHHNGVWCNTIFLVIMMASSPKTLHTHCVDYDFPRSLIAHPTAFFMHIILAKSHHHHYVL